MRVGLLPLVACFAGVGCGSGAPPSTPSLPAPSPTAVQLAVAVSVPLGGENQPVVGSPCGLSNIPPPYYPVLNANAKIKNEAGVIVGVVTIPSHGLTTARTPPDQLFDKNCKFEARAALQGSANFYTLDLGPGFDPQTKSAAELASSGWRFEVGY
jgi:hypothetical protein